MPVSYPRVRSALFAFSFLVSGSCGGDDDGPSTSVRVSALATDATTLAGPRGSSLAIPAGASETDVTIVLSAPNTRRQGPASTTVVSGQFRLEPEGKTFLVPLEITIPITPSSLPAGKTIDDVVVVRAPQGTGSDAFVPLPTRREGNAVVAQTEHFSDFLAVVSNGSESAFGTCTDGICAAVETCDACPADCGLCLPSNDTTPPSVLAVDGPTDATTVRGDAAFVVRFDEEVLAASLSTVNFALTDATSTPVAGTFSATNAVVTFTPAVPLVSSSTYLLTIVGVRDLAGNVMTAPFTASFTTTTRALLSITLPSNGATGVGQNSNPDFVFESDVDTATITAQTTDGPCTGSVQVSADDFATCLATDVILGATEDLFGLDPRPEYPGDSVVRIRFTSDARDANGFSLTELAPYSFTVVTDAQPPSLVDSSPQDGETNVDPATIIVLTFSEPILASSVTGSSVRLTDGEITIPCTRTVVGNVVTLTPAGLLSRGYSYYVEITNVFDLADNGSADEISSVDFQTLDGPTLSDSYPLYYDVGVHPDADIELAFDSPLAQGTLTMQTADSTTCSGTVQLSDGTTCYGGTIEFVSSESLTIRAPTSLPLLARMTLTITAGATDIDAIPFNGGPILEFRVSPVSDFALAFTGAYPSNGNLGGISGADLLCDSTGLGLRKAFLMTDTRRACSTAWCGTDMPGSEADTSVDWVLRPATYYVNPAGELMFLTDPIAPIPTFGITLTTAVGQGTDFYFGGEWNWTHTMGGDDCSGFTDGSGSSNVTLGQWDSIDTIVASGWLDGGTDLCSSPWGIFCVAQPPATPHATH